MVDHHQRVFSYRIRRRQIVERLGGGRLTELPQFEEAHERAGRLGHLKEAARLGVRRNADPFPYLAQSFGRAGCRRLEIDDDGRVRFQGEVEPAPHRGGEELLTGQVPGASSYLHDLSQRLRAVRHCLRVRVVLTAGVPPVDIALPDLLQERFPVWDEIAVASGASAVRIWPSASAALGEA